MAASDSDTDPVHIFLQMTRSAGNATIAILLDEFGSDAIYVLGPGTPYAAFKEIAATGNQRLYAGHFLFGAHRHVGRPATYFTTLRYPIDQLLSRYEAMARRTGQHPDMDAWLGRDFETSNAMIKRLLGVGILPGDKGLYDAVADAPLTGDFVVGEAEYERAVANLDRHFDCVLIMEHFVESMVVLQRALGCTPLFSLRRQFINRAETPIRRRDYPADVVDRLTEQNEFDIRLYQTARKRFLEHVAAQDAAFRADVATMKRVADIVQPEGDKPADDMKVLERLMVIVNGLGREGKRADAVRLVRAFTAKEIIGQVFCQRALRFLRVFAEPRQFYDEVERYRGRFGDDEFLTGILAEPMP